MIARHTFKALISAVVDIEDGIAKFESAINCHLDDNWMTKASCSIIRTISEGFFDTVEINSDEESFADIIGAYLSFCIYGRLRK